MNGGQQLVVLRFIIAIIGLGKKLLMKLNGNMHKEFKKWLKRKRYSLHGFKDEWNNAIWIVNKRGGWKWSEIKDYEY